jgi:hypothetical protein
MKKETYIKALFLLIAAVIFVACNNAANVDITERFLMDAGFTVEVDLLEKKRKTAWQKIDITTEEREEIITLIDQTVSETRAAARNRVHELYPEDVLQRAIKNKNSAEYKTIKNNLVNIFKAQIEELNEVIEIGISDIRYRYGCCLQ